MKNKLIALVGPTGVGKTETSLNLALLTNSEIISCDSMQVYRGMDIGTAKATETQMARVAHHLIDIADPKDSYSVCDYVRDAKAALEDIFSRGKNVLLVGGTGLYADSFIHGTDYEAESGGSDDIRDELEAYAAEYGNEALHEMLKPIDEESYEKIHPNNVKRVIRAIEYYRLTGRTISEHNREDAKKKSPYEHIYIGLTRERLVLYDRIDMRVDEMMRAGLLDEVFTLWKSGARLSHTSMQALGYKELIHYIEGRCTLCEAVNFIKRDSRRYAKRQLTWFGRNKNIHWINMDDKADGDASEMAYRIIQNTFKE